jgi:Zn-dependent protease with chaperone function
LSQEVFMSLNREESRAFIAPEIGHLVNGDARRQARLIGWLAGIRLPRPLMADFYHSMIDDKTHAEI